MRIKSCLTAAAIVTASLSLGVTSFAQDKPSAGTNPMMDCMKANQPGPEHALLKKMAGDWKAVTVMKLSADAPEVTGRGELDSEMKLNDRYLESEFEGEFMGQKFKGKETIGFDTMKKKFVTVWIDNSSTGVMTAEGTADASGKVITYTGEAPCPAAGGKVMPFRQIVTIKDDNHYGVEMFTCGADGKEFKSLQITYTRD